MKDTMNERKRTGAMMVAAWDSQFEGRCVPALLRETCESMQSRCVGIFDFSTSTILEDKDYVKSRLHHSPVYLLKDLGALLCCRAF
jgi:hypothetical protein